MDLIMCLVHIADTEPMQCIQQLTLSDPAPIVMGHMIHSYFFITINKWNTLMGHQKVTRTQIQKENC